MKEESSLQCSSYFSSSVEAPKRRSTTKPKPALLLTLRPLALHVHHANYSQLFNIFNDLIYGFYRYR